MTTMALTKNDLDVKLKAQQKELVKELNAIGERLEKEYEEKYEALKQKTDTAIATCNKMKEDIDALKTSLDKERQINESVTRKCLIQEADTLAHTLILSGSSVPAVVRGENTLNTATQVIRDTLGVNVNANAISSAYRIGKINNKNKIALKFTSKEHKRDLISVCINKKCETLFLSENLTQSVNNMLYHLRQIRKENSSMIYKMHTADGVTRVKSERMKEYVSIITRVDFDNYLKKVNVRNPLDETQE